MKLRSILAVGALLSLGWMQPAQAQAAGCTIKELRKLFGSDEVSKALFVRYRNFNPGAQKGVVAILGHANPELGGQVVDDILEIFQPPVRDENPFGSDEAIFEAIGDFTEQVGADLVMPPGMERTIRELANRGAGDEDGVLFFQGAVFDLFTAKTARSKGLEVASFQKELTVLDANGVAIGRREADLVTSCDGCPGGFLHHENKNWSSELSGLTDPRLVGLASQFQRDILLHAASGFATWRLNLRSVVSHQRDLIRNELLKQFDSPLVAQAFDDARRRELKEAFVEAWDSDSDAIVEFF